jgi:Ca-activated chloride channel family protein
MGQVLSVPPDPDTLRQISQITGGTFTQAADAGQLDSVYKKLGSKVGVRHVKREVSSSFAGAGLVLLLFGLTAGLRRRGRVA